MRRVDPNECSRSAHRRIVDDREGFNVIEAKRRVSNDSVRRGFPSYTVRWFERPVFRKMQIDC
eukprot:186774-Amphidinium_carterae.1